MYKVTVEQAIVEAFRSVPTGNKKSVILSGSKEGPYSVMAVVVDNVLSKAEVHDESADIWHVVNGEAIFMIGGEVENPTLHKSKEWVADSIRGGIEYPVKPGDVIDIPPGTPHQIDARGRRAEFIIVKVDNIKS